LPRLPTREEFWILDFGFSIVGTTGSHKIINPKSTKQWLSAAFVAPTVAGQQRISRKAKG
jgi:hypothetical protein